MGHFSRQSCEETDWTRPESLPNRSNPAPETGQPKITSSAGRSPIPGASREVSFRSERQQESSQHLGAVQELLVWNTPRWGRASAPHSAHKHSAATSAMAARARPSHTRDLQSHQAGGTGGEGTVGTRQSSH